MNISRFLRSFWCDNGVDSVDVPPSNFLTNRQKPSLADAGLRPAGSVKPQINLGLRPGIEGA